MSKTVVKSNLKKEQKLDSGFIILDVVELDELKAEGIWAKHEKCGVEVFHVFNDDAENLFSYTFTTPPYDNTGVAHILEHSVLCGSERYPLKDAFKVLDQGSLQTFLNALTFPDKTVYPASSPNEHDYFNLMSVYGDAVFRPLIPEWVFMQEGHRLEFQNGKLAITGVVYNEMKGAFSSLDKYAYNWSFKSVMPDTPYDFVSGGDPLEIPNLTWDDFKEYHKKYYSPANCRIFLAGNISTEKQLTFLNEEFFSKLQGGKACEPINKTKPWKEPKKFHVLCPAGNESKATIYLSWLCSDITNLNENFALDALSQILFGHDGSPLTRILIESGLGEDLAPVTGLNGNNRETIFSAGLKNAAGDTNEIGKAVEDLITGELRRLVNEGIPPEEIEAALMALEFSQKEIRRSRGPFSFVWMVQSLTVWLHGCKPWDGLLIQGMITKVKENLNADNRYFESLIQKYLLDNPHHALVIIEPKEDFLPKQEEKLSLELMNMEKNMSDDDKQNIIAKSSELEKIQNEPNSPEALASIPHLSRSDLSPRIKTIHRRHEDLSGIPALCHELHTNGITYIELSFPVDIFPQEDYIWLPFFSRVVTAVGLPGKNYAEVSSLLARTVGSFFPDLITKSPVKGTPRYLDTASGSFDLSGRDRISFYISCLDEKIIPSLDLALRMISEADFSDPRRINDLVFLLKNEIDSSFAPAGHNYSSSRASRFNSRSRMVDEYWGGITQIKFVHNLAKMDTGEIIKKLKYIQEKINNAGLIVNITGGDSGLSTASAGITQRFSKFGPPVPRYETEAWNFTNDNALMTEVFASKTLQVGFAAMTLNAAPFNTMEEIADTILMHQLNTGALWEDIRMKGGAYGGSSFGDILENAFGFYTYRDPNPLRSLDTFKQLLKENSSSYLQHNNNEDCLVKTIIGCYAKFTYPRTPVQEGSIDFFRFLHGIEDSYRKNALERLISITSADVKAAYTALGSKQLYGTVIIAGEKTAEEAAKALGVDVQMLPI
ncbi:MAG: insulinase family protein [Treponema sp.]|nr:insulinase family protein [Treponema sp.]